MHEGCSGSFESGKQVVDKVRIMGFSGQFMPLPMQVSCGNCEETFQMEKFEEKCPGCGAVHAVTPCHAFDPVNVMSAGVGY